MIIFENVEKELEQMLQHTKIVIGWYRERRTGGSAFIIGVSMYAFEKRLQNLYFEEEISPTAYKRFQNKFNELKKDVRTMLNVKDHGLRDAMSVKIWTEKDFTCDENEDGYTKVFKKEENA